MDIFVKGRHRCTLQKVDADRIGRTSQGACKWYQVQELTLVDIDTGSRPSAARFRSNATTKAARFFKKDGWKIIEKESVE